MDYTLLIHKRLQGTLTERERQALEAWLQTSPQHRMQAAQIERLWQKSASYKEGLQPDTERALANFKARLQAEKEKSAVPVVVPAKVIQKRSRYAGFRIAAGIAVVLAIGLLWLTYFNPQVQYLTVRTEAGEKKEVQLADGTKIWLNEHSTLRYPESFSRNSRQVALEGEAFFEVTANAAKPFIVELSQTRVKVIGTAFNVRSYLNEDFTQVTVSSGTVEFSIDATEQSKTLTAKQQATYRHKKSFDESRDEDLNALAWISGNIFFSDKEVEKIVRFLERYYGVTIDISKANIRTCRYTMQQFNHPALESILEGMQNSLNFKLIKKDNSYQIIGGSCPN